MRYLLTTVALLGLWAGLPPSGQAQGEARSRDLLDRYCVTCHNERARTGGLALDEMDLGDIPEGAEVWEKVVRKVSTGMMPPESAPRPSPEALGGLVTTLTAALDEAAARRPSPGSRLIHRMNRTEYANGIRDLLDLEVDTESLLPPDDSGYGFDNIADVLGVSPTLLERYLFAAGKIAALALGDPEIGIGSESWRVRQDASQNRHIDGMPLGTVGGLKVTTNLSLDGEYVFDTTLFRTNLGAMRGLEYPHQFEITVDGTRVHLASFGGDEDFKRSLVNVTEAGDDVEARLSARVALPAGPHEITAGFLHRSSTENSVRLQPYIRSSNDTLDPTGHAHMDLFTITGPFHPTGPGDTPSRRRILVCAPETPAQETPCAREILARLANRAYRGEAGPVDVDRLMEFYEAGRDRGGFESGIQLALERILASPKFIYRVEQDPPGTGPGDVYSIDDLELASRLSFFLWSSIPDEDLLEAARRGELGDPAGRDRQVRRMMDDPKSSALVENFAGQWLYLRNLKNMIPNSVEFPDFDDNLRVAFRRETELFFESIIREDRSVLDLMTADYTFLNERLAAHYGIPNIYGSHFRRVELTGDERRGLLGQGSILMVTSHTDRTSPVVRGKWILDNLMGAPPPPPPANVPPLDETASEAAGRVLTLRERMEVHRTNPVCAGCHKMMDPIGFAMENFDAVGAWRNREGGTGGTPIDASGQLVDGTPVEGVVGLRRALLADPEIFVRTLTEKLMIYAIGRGLAPEDMPAIRKIVRDARAEDYRFSSLIHGIIDSVPFRMRMAVSTG